MRLLGKGMLSSSSWLSPFFGLAWHKLCLVISFAQVGCVVASWLKEDSLICRRISFGASISASTPALPFLHRLTFCRTPALNLTICPTIQSFNAYLSVVLVYELLVAVSWTSPAPMWRILNGCPAHKIIFSILLPESFKVSLIWFAIRYRSHVYCVYCILNYWQRN